MEFTHFDDCGNAVMVDVGAKPETERVAVAAGKIHMSEECFGMVSAKTAKKGDVLGTARIAGIMAAKRTSELIPLCHPVALASVSIDFEQNSGANEISAVCTAKTTGRTGVEMEALHGVSAALLTVYDMCKAVDRAMLISDIRLLEKSGGKSGHFRNGGK